jgi:hypothetical protein
MYTIQKPVSLSKSDSGELSDLRLGWRLNYQVNSKNI